MNPVLAYVLLFALPTAVGFALIGAWRAARWLAEARYRARFQALPPEPIERLEADLRRLRAELEDTETRSSLTAKHHRVQAVRGAYLDTLAVACRRLDIGPPRGGDRASQAEIYRVEAALRHGGIEVRTQAPETVAP